MSDPLVLMTERLMLRPLAVDDADLTVELMTDPAAMRYWGPVLSEDEAAAKQPGYIQRGGNGGIGMWCVDDRASGEKLGWAMLLPINPDYDGTDWDQVVEDVCPESEVEVGYMFKPAAWGKGVATETCTRLLQFAFEGTPLLEVVAVTHPDNAASQNVLRKSGLADEGLRRAYQKQALGFRATREQWLAGYGADNGV